MKTKIKTVKRNPQIIYTGSKPVSVIIDIKKYKEMLDRLEDIEDIKILKDIMKKKPSFTKLNDFLNKK